MITRPSEHATYGQPLMKLINEGQTFIAGLGSAAAWSPHAPWAEERLLMQLEPLR